MLDDEGEGAKLSREVPPVSGGGDPAAPHFAWGYLVAILVGTAIIIAIVCTIATLSKKQEASFSARLEPGHASCMT